MPDFPSGLRSAALTATLRKCPLFRGLPGEILDEIVAFTVIKPLKKGDYLFREGDPSFGFYVVQKGTINVHRVNALGKEQVIHLFRAGESFAEGTLATSAGYPADAVAAETSQLLLIKKEDFVALLYRKPELALRMLASMSMHLRDLVGQIDDLKLKSVETRLAHWLVKRCPDPESAKPFDFELSTSKRMLASEIGTVAETLSRTLAKLRAEGLVEVRGSSVRVISPLALTTLLRRHLGEE